MVKKLIHARVNITRWLGKRASIRYFSTDSTSLKWKSRATHYIKLRAYIVWTLRTETITRARGTTTTVRGRKNLPKYKGENIIAISSRPFVIGGMLLKF